MTHVFDFPVKNGLISALILGLATLAVGVDRVEAYTPEDPFVKKMVDKGCAYLEANAGKPQNEGERILIGYAIFKAHHDETNSVVKAAISSAVKLADGVEKLAHSHKIHYEAGVATLLLAAVDSNKYRPQLEKLQKHFLHHQHSGGGFTYHNEEKGDVSQTQYALLAIWTLDRAGIALDYQKVASAIQWLMRVQDPSGGWPYMGVDPGPGKLIPQSRVTHGMAMAGGSSVLIAGDALRLWGDTSSQDDDPGIIGLPKAIKVYKEDKNVDRRQRVNVSKEAIFRSIGGVRGYFQKTPYQRGKVRFDFYYYQLYTQERFESFIEIAKGAPKDSSPAWYNKGVDDLNKYQDADGGWTDGRSLPGIVNTSFAVLFLVRSTQKSIISVAGGGTIGGQGFGADISKSKLVKGKVEVPKKEQHMKDMLKMLEEEGADSAGGKSLPDDLQLSEDATERAVELDGLERLVRGSRSWQARRIAAKTLGKSDEMRVVPALIFALSDPDDVVRVFARDGLRFISRKFEGYDMPNKPDLAELEDAQDKWRAWYKTMDPSFVFLDD